MRRFSYCIAGIASFALANMACIPAAHAQAAIYGSSVGTYGVLNGENLTLYVDQYGDLGAPRTSSSPSKPGGTLVSGIPDVNSNGSVALPDGTYGALFTANSTAGESIQQSIQSKTEYITLGNASALEGYGISLNSGKAFVPYSSLPAPTFTVSGATGTITPTTQLSATSSTTYISGANDLGISQTVSFNESGYKNIAQFTVTFTNNGTSNISGLQYARAVNPNQDVSSPGGSTTTNQSFGTPVDKTQFAINSTGPASNLPMALGVRPGDANSAGSTIYAVSGAASEASLLANPSYLTTYNQNNYLQLTPMPGEPDAATFVDRQITGLTFVSDNYLAYLSSGGTTDLFTNAGTGATATPDFAPDDSGDSSLVLLSPVLPTITPGMTDSYTFYYTFGPVTPETTGTPEPGAASLFLSGTLGAVSLAWRTRRRRS